MAKKKLNSKKQFFISLDDIDLTDEQIKRIDKGIQNVVLKELASIDNVSNFAVKADLGKTLIPGKPRPFPFPFPWGIIIYNPKNPIEGVLQNIQKNILQ